MKNRHHSQGSPSDDLDALFPNLRLSEPSSGFADRLMDRLKEEDGMKRPAVSPFQTEWKNGLIAAAATVVFVASDMPARIMSMNPGQIGIFIQLNVLHAVHFGLELIRFN